MSEPAGHENPVPARVEATPSADKPAPDGAPSPDPSLRPFPVSPEFLDPDAVKTLRRLIRFGHTSYLVGGCVRDLVLGREPKDFDISTTARPRQVRRYFRNSRVIGRRFRLAHVLYGDKVIEVSTFRARLEGVDPDDDRDGAEKLGVPETDSSRDLLILRDNVFGGPEDDARRRDFTINGLFYDIDQQLIIDHVGGMEDIAKHVIRTIGDPEVRFPEDPVRILRAIKFAARLDFAFDSATFRAMQRHRGDILRCAAPRVLEEIHRMLRGGCAVRTFDLLVETKVLEVVLPEVAAVIVSRPEQVDLYRRRFAVLDHMVHDGYEPTSPVLFGLLYFPVTDLYGVLEDESHENWRAAFSEFETMMESAARRLSLPRRDFGRLHQAAALQRRLAPGPRKRRFTRLAVARQPCFEEALLLFRIEAESTGHWTEEMVRWREAYERGLPARARAAARPGGSPVNGAALSPESENGGEDPAGAAAASPGTPARDGNRPPGSGRRRRRRRGRGRHRSSRPNATRMPPE